MTPGLRTHFDNSDELCEYVSGLCGGVALESPVPPERRIQKFGSTKLKIIE